MPNGKSLVQTLELEVPTYLPLSETADKYNLSKNVLTQLIQAGKIGAVQLPSRKLLVAANNNPGRNRISLRNVNCDGEGFSAILYFRFRYKYPFVYSVGVFGQIGKHFGRIP